MINKIAQLEGNIRELRDEINSCNSRKWNYQGIILGIREAKNDLINTTDVKGFADLFFNWDQKTETYRGWIADLDNKIEDRSRRIKDKEEQIDELRSEIEGLFTKHSSTQRSGEFEAY